MSDANMTPRQLARQADIGETTVYALLSGLRGANVGFNLIDAIAKATNKPLYFFSADCDICSNQVASDTRLNRATNNEVVGLK